MPRALLWHPEAERELLDLPHWRDSEAIAIAAQLLAERDVGFVRRIARQDGADELRLYVGQYYLRLAMSDTALSILRVVRWRS
jgi:hypothetical protein